MGAETLGTSSNYSNLFLCLWSVSRNRPTVSPLNITIIPWRLLGPTVIVITAVYYFQIKYLIQLHIQSFAGVKKILLPWQLIYPTSNFHCSQNLVWVRYATTRSSLPGNPSDIKYNVIEATFVLATNHLKNKIFSFLWAKPNAIIENWSVAGCILHTKRSYVLNHVKEKHILDFHPKLDVMHPIEQSVW